MSHMTTAYSEMEKENPVVYELFIMGLPYDEFYQRQFYHHNSRTYRDIMACEEHRDACVVRDKKEHSA